MILKVVISIATILIMSGCSSNPKSSVEDLYDSIKKGDLVKLSRSTTERTTGAFSLAALKNCSEDKKSYTDDMKLVEKCLVEEYSNTTLKSVNIFNVSETEADANVTLLIGLDEKEMHLNVYKIENQWKVSIYDENISEILENRSN